MRKQLTPEQQAAKAARREKFKTLWKQVAAMPEEQRVLLSRQYGFRTCEGHELSLCNHMLIALQNPAASVLGGFRQWQKCGRVVRKGEHGVMIWVPTGDRKPANGDTSAPDATTETAETNGTRFLIGTLFDIAQTDELGKEGA